MADEFITNQIQLDGDDEAPVLFGNGDSNLKMLEDEFGVKIVTRGETLNVTGPPEAAALAEETIKQLLAVIRSGIRIGLRDTAYAAQTAKQGKIEYFSELYDEEITRNAKGKAIRVKTIGQRHYIEAVRKNDLVFGIGPAGTGKTYLAVVMAVGALKSGKINKIILTRPAVEAGESLGFYREI